MGEGLGDCFFIELENDYCETIIMVDGRKGNGISYNRIEGQLEEYYKQNRKIDYLIVTHIDADHINGINRILKLPETNIIKKLFEKTIVIYNHVTRPVVNYGHAVIFEDLIKNYHVIPTCKKNYIPYSSPGLKILSYEKRQHFDPRDQENDMEYAYLTLLHPSDKWEIDQVHQDYLDKTSKSKVQPKAELVNLYSIAFLIEYRKKTVLFTGDGNIEILKNKISKLKNMCEGASHRKIDLIKMPHHGAKSNNIGLVEFAKNHQCGTFIVTGEKVWNHKHPSKELIVDLIKEFQTELEIYTNVQIDILQGETEERIELQVGEDENDR